MKSGRGDFAALLSLTFLWALPVFAEDAVDTFMSDGKAALERSDYSSAASKYRDAVTAAESAGPPLRLAAALEGMAKALTKQGRGLEAGAIYQRALSIREQQQGPGHKDVAATLIDMAAAQLQAGNADEAEKLLAKARVIKESNGEKDKIEVALSSVAPVENKKKEEEPPKKEEAQPAKKEDTQPAKKEEEKQKPKEEEKSKEEEKAKEEEKDKAERKEEEAKKKKTDVDFGPYMADLQRRIKRAWFPPRGEETKRVVVVFKIAKDGKMSSLRIDKSSETPGADAAALRAVENASPFRPLPKGAPKEVDIQFTFDYNVFNSKEKFRDF